MNHLDNEKFYNQTVKWLDIAIRDINFLSEVCLFDIDEDKQDKCISYLYELKQQAYQKANPYHRPTEDELRWICPACGANYNEKKESFMLHQEECFNDYDDLPF